MINVPSGKEAGLLSIVAVLLVATPVRAMSLSGSVMFRYDDDPEW
jgi:hypothetical protein